MRKLYEKYHVNGFEIIGISCDKESAEIEWKKAIQLDSIFYWPQILTTPPNTNSNSRKLDLLKIYNIQAFPTHILIDKKNFIVYRIDSEFDLENKLKLLYEQ